MIFVDGRSTAELSHAALTRMLNGGRRPGGADGANGAGQGEDATVRKLIVLPKRYGKKLGIGGSAAEANVAIDGAAAHLAAAAARPAKALPSPPVAPETIGASPPAEGPAEPPRNVATDIVGFERRESKESLDNSLTNSLDNSLRSKMTGIDTLMARTAAQKAKAS